MSMLDEPLTRFAARCANALVGYADYLGMAVWPVRLSVSYPFVGSRLAVFYPFVGDRP